MRLDRNPLINSLIKHSLKLNILFFGKIQSNTFWLNKTFSCWSQVTMMYKKIFFLTIKIGGRFRIGDLPTKPAKKKKKSSSWKIIEVTHLRRSGQGRGRGVIIILQKHFSSKFLILTTGVPRCLSPPEIAARWCYRLHSNNLTAHYNSQFCVSFNFFLPGSQKMPLSVSELGLNII